MKPKAFLRKLGACSEAVEWVGDKTASEAWRTCRRGDWMLWLLGKLAGPPGDERRKPLVKATCACARLALRYVEPGEDRPRIAIETAEAWTRGEATIEQVRAAAYAAHAAAADAAAYAAADAAANAAADAAANAAAYAADAAAAADARKKILSKCATIVRRYYPRPPKMVKP